jgi:hypothetical protein
LKTVLRIAEVGGRVLEGDVWGAIDIRLRSLPLNGGVVALALSSTYECANEACGLALRYNPLDCSHI